MAEDITTIKISDLIETSESSSSYVVVTRIEGGVRVSRKLSLSVILSAISNALSEYYTKSQVDSLIANVQVDLSAYSTTEQVSTMISDALDDALFVGRTIESNVTIEGL